MPPGGDAAAWVAARPLFTRLLAAVIDERGAPAAHGANLRSSLAHYLLWLADDDVDLLTVRVALSDEEIDRYLATEGSQRRRSHRSRVAARSSLRSFRAGHPTIIRPARRTTGEKDSVLPPVEDWEFDVAFAQCEGFRTPVTRFHTRSALVLCRAAGLDGGDARWVRGDDVARRPGAGLWVHVSHPARTRDVPVLARFADTLEDLSSTRGDRCLISDVAAPTAGEVPGALCGMVNRSLGRARSTATVSPGRLRKAWLVEHVGANTPLRTLLGAAGLRSLRAIDDLVVDYAPPLPTKDAHIAWELGGVTRKEDRS